jgi:hypothetical protein
VPPVPRVPRRVGLLGRGEVEDGPFTEEERHHCAYLVERRRYRALGDGVAQPGRRAVGKALETLVGALLAQDLQRRDPSGHGQRVAGERARLVGRSERCHRLHDLAPTAESADGQTAADDFAQTRQIGKDAVPLLGAAPGDPEASDDLVEDEDRAVVAAEPAQTFEEAGARWYDAHVASHRLDDHTGDFLAALGKQRLERGDIVVLGQNGVSRGPGGHAWAVGQREREYSAARSGQEGVGVTVVAADELDHLVTASEPPGHAHRAHRRLGA